MRSFFRRPRLTLSWSLAARLSLAAIAGAILALTGIVIYTSKASSYMGNDPKACANCHVMRAEYDGWAASSHKNVATCNDCHTPPDFVGHYTVKVMNGIRHSTFFTLGLIPKPIRATSATRDVVQDNCVRCHGEMVSLISHEGTADEIDCLRCHSRVGHL